MLLLLLLLCHGRNLYSSHLNEVAQHFSALLRQTLLAPQRGWNTQNDMDQHVTRRLLKLVTNTGCDWDCLPNLEGLALVGRHCCCSFFWKRSDGSNEPSACNHRGFWSCLWCWARKERSKKSKPRFQSQSCYLPECDSDSNLLAMGPLRFQILSKEGSVNRGHVLRRADRARAHLLCQNPVSGQPVH